MREESAFLRGDGRKNRCRKQSGLAAVAHSYARLIAAPHCATQRRVAFLEPTASYVRAAVCMYAPGLRYPAVVVRQSVRQVLQDRENHRCARPRDRATRLHATLENLAVTFARRKFFCLLLTLPDILI